MDITGLGAIFDFGKAIIDRFVPDPAAKMKATMDLAVLQQQGELAKLAQETGLAQGQIDLNKVEASNTSLFISGWRPFVGWTCGSGLAFQFLLAPLLTWSMALIGKPVVFPTLDLSTLLTLLFGLLGLGGMRTFEKLNGVASK